MIRNLDFHGAGTTDINLDFYMARVKYKNLDFIIVSFLNIIFKKFSKGIDI